MFRIFSKSLMIRLSSQFFAVALIPVIAVAVLSFHFSKSSLDEAALNKLEAVNHIKKLKIINLFRSITDDLEILASTQEIQNAFIILADHHKSKKSDAPNAYNVDDPEYESIYREIDPFFRNYVDKAGFSDILLIDKDHGHVMYSVAMESDLGANLASGPFKNSALAKVWSNVAKSNKTRITDYTIYAPTGKPVLFIGTPVHNESKEIVAVLAIKISTDKVNNITQQMTGMGATGETYLVGQDLLMRSSSRFEKQGSAILKRKVETEAAMEGLKGTAGTREIIDYRGVDVLSSYTDIGMKRIFNADFDWAIISEIDESEAALPIRKLGMNIFWTGLILVTFAILFGYRSARKIVRPVQKLSNHVRKITGGDLTISIEVKGNDEITHLFEGMKQMLERMNTIVSMIVDTGLQSNRAASEISAAIEEQVVVSSQQSGSVAEITSTMEELSATSSQIAGHADSVTKMAASTLKDMENGVRAVDQVMGKMNEINRDNQSNINEIIDLGKKSEEISKVMEIINSIADQTKLIAFNAALEASSAGEAGKRFNVVAMEIRRLADNVMESTSDIENKIHEIQEAVNHMIISSEKGSKGIQEGLEYSTETAAKLKSIVGGAKSTTEAAKQISLSTQQQKTASEQIVTGLREIADGAKQNNESVNQINNISKEMIKLVNELKEIIIKFKIKR